jgi:hypothetical protein
MYNNPDQLQAEIAYRRDQIRRDWRPIRERRRLRALKESINRTGQGEYR